MSSTLDIEELEGAGFARGEAYGKRRRLQIERFLTDWLGSLDAAGVGDAQGYVRTMLERTRFQRAIGECTPALLEEMRGVAAGSGVPVDLVLAAQLMDEEWAYRVEWLGDARAAGDSPPKCSSVAIHPRNGLTWIGQNMDLGSYTDGHQVVMRLGASGAEPAALIFTVGCMIGLLGVNSAGFAVCVNALPQLPTAHEGLPVAFVVRWLLTAKSVAEAARMVTGVPHATGQHYLIADAGGVRSFEASAAGVMEYHAPDPSRILRTNHPLAGDAATASSVPVNSMVRLEVLRARLEDGAPELEEIKAALSSCDDPEHPVSRAVDCAGSAAGSMGFTTGSMVSALREGAEEVESWVSAGPPHVNPYVRVGLRR